MLLSWGYSEPLGLQGILGTPHGTCPDQSRANLSPSAGELGSGRKYRCFCSISSLFAAAAIKDAITLQICSIRTKYIQNFPFGSTGMVFSMCVSYTLGCFNVLVVLNSLSCSHIIREPGMGRSAPVFAAQENEKGN